MGPQGKQTARPQGKHMLMEAGVPEATIKDHLLQEHKHFHPASLHSNNHTYIHTQAVHLSNTHAHTYKQIYKATVKRLFIEPLIFKIKYT